MTQDYQGPLQGLNVIDFGHYYAGPMVGMLLADQGANVIRIVRPDETESSASHQELPPQQFRLLNRNKKLLTLDLKTPEGKERAKLLIERADVVIENFRPGVMKRLGLDYASVKDSNPGLIYLSLPGFASSDEGRAHIQAWEGIMSAAACVFSEVSWVRQKLNYPPVYSWSPHCSTHGALHGGIAVMAALLAREDHDIGTIIEVPLVSAGLAAFSLDSMTAAMGLGTGELEENLKPHLYDPADSQVEQLAKLESAHRECSQWSDPFASFYACADGRKIMLYTNSLVPHIFDRVLKGLDIYKRVLQEGYVNVGPWTSGLDNNLSNVIEMSLERKQCLKKMIADAFLTKPSGEWEAVLGKKGIPLTVVRTREEWLALEPVLRTGLLVKMGDGQATLTVPGRLVDISGPEGTIKGGYREAEPMTFAEVEKMLAERVVRKSSLPEQSTLKKSDLLRGLKVLDLSNIVAGPTGGYTLAEYGADVIKADPPYHGSHPAIIFCGLWFTQGKRSILTDVKTAPGREVFNRLLRWADVVIHNVLDDTAERLGITQEQLKKINSNAISCQISGFGGTGRGGWEMRPGFDCVTQSALGIAAHYGSPDEPHIHGGASCGDVTGGLSLAFTALLGNYQLRKTGYAAEARTALARAVNHYQLPYMIADEGGRSDWGESHGQFALGDHWWQRLYQCQDGWMYVGASADRANLLAELVTGHADGDEQILSEVFAEQTLAHWEEKLGAAEIACHRVLNYKDIYHQTAREVDNDAVDEAASAALDILRWTDHPGGMPVTVMGSNKVCVGEDRSWYRLHPQPRHGEHTRDILKEIGYREDEIAELIRIGVSYEYLPGMGNKDDYFFQPEKQS